MTRMHLMILDTLKTLMTLATIMALKLFCNLMGHWPWVMAHGHHAAMVQNEVTAPLPHEPYRISV